MSRLPSGYQTPGPGRLSRVQPPARPGRQPPFFAQGLGVGPGAVHEYHEVVRLCRLPDYANRDVNVLVGELVLAAGAA